MVAKLPDSLVTSFPTPLVAKLPDSLVVSPPTSFPTSSPVPQSAAKIRSLPLQDSITQVRSTRALAFRVSPDTVIMKYPKPFLEAVLNIATNFLNFSVKAALHDTALLAYPADPACSKSNPKLLAQVDYCYPTNLWNYYSFHTNIESDLEPTVLTQVSLGALLDQLELESK